MEVVSAKSTMGELPSSRLSPTELICQKPRADEIRLLNVDALNFGSGNAGDGGDASSGSAFAGDAGSGYRC